MLEEAIPLGAGSRLGRLVPRKQMRFMLVCMITRGALAGTFFKSRLSSKVITAAHDTGGWVGLEHGGPGSNGLASSMRLLGRGFHEHIDPDIRPEPSKTPIMHLTEPRNNILITISGFDAMWNGRWRFGGVRFRRL